MLYNIFLFVFLVFNITFPLITKEHQLSSCFLVLLFNALGISLLVPFGAKKRVNHTFDNAGIKRSISITDIVAECGYYLSHFSFFWVCIFTPYIVFPLVNQELFFGIEMIEVFIMIFILFLALHVLAVSVTMTMVCPKFTFLIIFLCMFAGQFFILWCNTSQRKLWTIVTMLGVFSLIFFWLYNKYKITNG